jgi:hypothetical protein
VWCPPWLQNSFIPIILYGRTPPMNFVGGVRKRHVMLCVVLLQGLIKNLKNKNEIKHQMQFFQATGNRLVIIIRSLLT